MRRIPHLVALMLLSLPASAAIDLSVTYWTRSELQGPAGAPVERRHYEVRWWNEVLAVVYAHEPMLVRTGRPAHNGYFHRLDIEYEEDFGATRLGLATGLHGSSNMFRHGDYHEEALTGRAFVVRDFGAFHAGLRADHAFGDFRIYPAVEATIETGRGRLEVALPTRLAWTHGPWSARLERYGQKWAALDATRTVESRHDLTEWRAAFGYRLSEQPRLGITVGASFATRMRYLDLDEAGTERALDPGFFIGFDVGF